jgi:S-adenosylmethionine hydrolase
VYAYTGARLASAQIEFEQLGPVLPKLVRLKIERARLEGTTLIGSIDIHDSRYGRYGQISVMSSLNNWA